MEKRFTIDSPIVLEAAELIQDNGIDLEKIRENVLAMLEAFGEDPQRDGLQRTPDRVSRMYVELLAGYRTDPVKLVNEALFEVNYDEMVIVRVSQHHHIKALVPERQLLAKLLAHCVRVRPAIDQYLLPRRRLDQDGIALPDIQETDTKRIGHESASW